MGVLMFDGECAARRSVVASRLEGDGSEEAQHPSPARISTTDVTAEDQTDRVSAVGAVVTPREAEVLALVGRHLTNAQIAAELCISVRTVESHVATLLRKLHVPDRRGLAGQAGAAKRPARVGLPVPVTPFIGRVAERAALTRALAEHRLVTAVGPGGIGKSRLAIHVAADRSDDVWFVDLVRTTDPTAVIGAVAEVVRVPEQLTASPEAALVASLGRDDGLLVLDNCEHLLDGVRDCVDLLVIGCPRLRVLATSRTRLMVAYEHLYAVPGLSVTDDGGDAVDLFAVRVLEATGDSAPPDARRVASLCQALDGMALAIELAASRYPTLGLDGLEAGLHERLRFFTVGSPTAGRNRSLRDTIAWSYDLLAPADRALLRGVALFASWFDVPAAQAVAVPNGDRADVADGLARLADHSLLLVARGQPTRYRVLETIRQYGQEQLEAVGELAAAEARHEAWCCGVLADLAATEPDDAWCARFDGVVDDARGALVRCAAHHDHRADTATMAAQLAGQLWLRGRLAEAQRRYEQAAELSAEPEKRVTYLRLAAGAASSGFDGTEFLRLLRAAADEAIALGDRGGAARDLALMSLFITRAPGVMAQPRSADEAAALLAEAREVSGGSAQADAAIFAAEAFADYRELSVERAEQAVLLARQAGDAAVEEAALDLLILLHLRLRDMPAALDAVQRRDAAVAGLAMDPRNGFEHSDHRMYAAAIFLGTGDLRAAAGFADRMARLPFHRDEDFLGMARRLTVDALAGQFDAVLHNADEFRISWERIGRPVVPRVASSAYAVAMVHGILGDDAQRRDWVRLTNHLLGAMPRLVTRAWMPTFDAIVDLHRGEYGAAVEHLAVDLDDPDTWWHGEQTLYRPWYAAVWAEAAVLARRDDAPVRIERARDAASHNPIASAMIERAAAFAAGNRDAIEDLAATFETLGCPYQQERTGVIASMIT
jgi:predicted ATPase/DNA-binding CsgD family transcriptional regulator